MANPPDPDATHVTPRPNHEAKTVVTPPPAAETVVTGTPSPASAPTLAAGEDPLIGAQLGACVIGRKIGEGGMGAAYLATHVALERQVVVKILPLAFSGSSELRERFLREARATAKLSHANVVHVYDVGAQDGVLYYVMEYVEGQSLDERIESGPLTCLEATQIVLGAARGLGAAHEVGVIHRDVKPANILLTTKGQAKVVDFGLARDVTKEGISATGQLLGTPHYMAPEQAAEGTADARADFYSLGVTYYQLLTRKLPFEGSSAFGVIQKHISEPPPAVGEHAPEAPAAVVACVERLLRKAPAERFPHAPALIEALEAIVFELRGGSSASATLAPPAPAAPRAGRLALGALAAAALVGLGVWLATPPSRPGPASNGSSRSATQVATRGSTPTSSQVAASSPAASSSPAAAPSSSSAASSSEPASPASASSSTSLEPPSWPSASSASSAPSSSAATSSQSGAPSPPSLAPPSSTSAPTPPLPPAKPPTVSFDGPATVRELPATLTGRLAGELPDGLEIRVAGRLARLDGRRFRASVAQLAEGANAVEVRLLLRGRELSRASWAVTLDTRPPVIQLPPRAAVRAESLDPKRRVELVVALASDEPGARIELRLGRADAPPLAAQRGPDGRFRARPSLRPAPGKLWVGRVPYWAQATDAAGNVARLQGELLVIPRGMVLVGDPASGKLGPHEAFFIDRHEVSAGELAAFLKASGAEPPRRFEARPAELPARHVSFTLAERYAARLGRRLPGEREWQRAAGWDQGRLRRYPWGAREDRELAVNVAFCQGRGGGPRRPGAMADDVSPWGCRDMAGNVQEWVRADPADGKGRQAVMGGHFDTAQLRGAMIEPRQRTLKPPGIELAVLGFRCARGLQPGEEPDR